MKAQRIVLPVGLSAADLDISPVWVTDLVGARQAYYFDVFLLHVELLATGGRRGYLAQVVKLGVGRPDLMLSKSIYGTVEAAQAWCVKTARAIVEDEMAQQVKRALNKDGKSWMPSSWDGST